MPSVRQWLRAIPAVGATLTVGSAKYLAALMITFALLTAEYVQTAVGYSVAQLLVVVSLLLVWMGARGPHSVAPMTRSEAAAREDGSRPEAEFPFGPLLLLYLAGTLNWALRANLELRKRQVAHTLRRARRRLRIRRV